MNSISILLILLAALIILVLGVYAGRLLFMLKAQNSKQKAGRDKRIASIQESIQTIAFAMQQQQCDLSEGVIRICRLLDALPVEPRPNYALLYPVTHQLFDLVKGYPTHEARSALTKLERRKQDKEREEFASQLESKVIKETYLLREFEVSS
jgi:hypothetical protein